MHKYTIGFHQVFWIGVIVGIVIAVIALLFLWTMRDTWATPIFKSKSNSLADLQLTNPSIGRMDTPPPKISQNKSWEELNPHDYSGRMNTPPPLTDEAPRWAENVVYCPFCGKKITPRMQKLLEEQRFPFCEFCGKKVA